ncbi:MAG: hypothetical protein ACOYO1_12440 [Bacteroidales bacterium]
MKAKNILILGLFIILGFAACKKDITSNGPSSQADSTRNDYVGSWACTEIPVAKNLNFDCTISIDANTETNIKIANFANLNSNAYAIVSAKSVILPKQILSGNTVEGYATMENINFIRWHYYVKDNTDSMAYNTTFNRKP